MNVKTGIGQDSHAFDFENKEKKLVLGGMVFENEPPLKANSDGDVILHALTNALSGVTGVNILGRIADDMCLKHGITDSREYVREALKSLAGYKITHVSFAIECSMPKLSMILGEIKRSISGLIHLSHDDIGITATTGEGLTPFGKGEGIQVICVVTAIEC